MSVKTHSIQSSEFAGEVSDFILDVARDLDGWGFIIDDYFGEETLNQTEE